MEEMGLSKEEVEAYYLFYFILFYFFVNYICNTYMSNAEHRASKVARTHTHTHGIASVE